MCRIWRSGCSPLPERVTQDVMNWRRNVQWIIKAEGHVVPELNVRNGRRKARHKQNKKEAARCRKAAKERNGASEKMKIVPFRAALKRGKKGIDHGSRGTQLNFLNCTPRNLTTAKLSQCYPDMGLGEIFHLRPSAY